MQLIRAESTNIGINNVERIIVYYFAFSSLQAFSGRYLKLLAE